MELNPGYPRWFHMAGCFFYLQREEFEKALSEADLFSMDRLFWSHLLKAACNGLLGRSAEAAVHLKHLLELKPGFPEKAGYLTGMYARYDDVAGKILQGLRKAGLKDV